MAFIGNTNTTQAFTPAIDYFSGNGSTTAFTLSRPVASVAQVQVTIDNVAQNPSSAYTVSANTITFTSAPLSGTNNIYVYYTSPITQVIAPSQGTVQTAQLGNITNIASGNSSLTLQTGSSPTTAVTVDTSQNVGIGTASPAYPLDVAGNLRSNSWIGRANGSAPSADCAIYRATDNTLGFSTASTERMRIDSSGNVLIATTNAITGITGAQLTASNTSENPAYINIFRDDTTIGNGQFLGYLQFCGRDATSSLGTAHAYVGAVAEADHGAGDNATAITFGTTPDNSSSMAERMRITNDGTLLVKKTASSSSADNNVGAQLGVTGKCIFEVSGDRALILNRLTDNGVILEFFRGAGNQVGNINALTSSVAYNTSSDYRLKKDIAPMTGALAKVTQLKPVTYKWKVDGEEGQGFIAHELQAVIPDCVTGDKDAVDADGNPVYQGIDTSFLVATLTSAIQELKAINDTQAETINALTARIVALENR